MSSVIALWAAAATTTTAGLRIGEIVACKGATPRGARKPADASVRGSVAVAVADEQNEAVSGTATAASPAKAPR